MTDRDPPSTNGESIPRSVRKTSPEDKPNAYNIPDERKITLRFETKNGDMLRLPLVSTPSHPRICTSEIEHEGDPKLVVENAFNGEDITVVQYRGEADG